MSLDKIKEKETKKNGVSNQSSSKNTASDPRFDRAKFDPRFVKPKLKDVQVKIDERFKQILEDDDFSGAPKVDKYGRKVNKDHRKEQLRRYYRLENEDEQDKKFEESESSEDEEVSLDRAGPSRKIDRARGELVEDVEESESADESDYYDTHVELEAGVEEEEQEAEDIPQGDATYRLAAVNMDWDHIRAVDLLKVFSSLSNNKSGSIKCVKVYQSEFGKERITKEEIDGPPVEIFENSIQEEDLDSDGEISAASLVKPNNGEEFNNEALRKYQLERLRYYYAVITCDSVETARHLYQECDGAEYECSANFFDLRYIPDDMEFNEEYLRDQAIEAPNNYKPIEFATDALRHSKVRLTWDDDDPERTHITRKRITKEDLTNMDLKAYLASSSDDEDGEEMDQKALREKYKALLNGSNADKETEQEEQGEMQITFTPGLSEKQNTKTDPNEETTIEAYKRKERERREKRRSLKLAENEARIAEEDEDEYWESKAERNKQNKLDKRDQKEEDEQVDNFDDPFFAEEMTMEDAESGEQVTTRHQLPDITKKKTKLSKAERMEKIRQRKELELLVDDEHGESKSHFDMKAILKSEKRGKKKKRSQSKEDEGDLQDDFELDVKDTRFDEIHTNPAYAIDPTSAHFKKTKAMSTLLQERNKRHNKDTVPQASEGRPRKRHYEGDELGQLVQSIKRRAGKT